MIKEIDSDEDNSMGDMQSRTTFVNHQINDLISDYVQSRSGYPFVEYWFSNIPSNNQRLSHMNSVTFRWSINQFLHGRIPMLILKIDSKYLIKFHDIFMNDHKLLAVSCTSRKFFQIFRNQNLPSYSILIPSPLHPCCATRKNL